MITELFGLECENIRSFILRVSGCEVSLDDIQKCIDVIIILFILAISWKYIKMAIIWFVNLCAKDRKWRKDYIKNNLDHIFNDYKICRDKGKYITTRMQNEAPSKYEDPLNSVSNCASQDFIDHFIKNVLVESNPDRLYCILADSGMGKTTALVNLYISYVESYTEKSLPFDIRIFSLTDDDILANISKVERKRNTILLLDALDENIDAVKDCREFLSNLEGVCRDFRFVVISCRTQFFADEEDQLKESKIKCDGETKGYSSYNNLYVSPFNNKEINDYVNKVFGKRHWLCNTKKRKKVDVIMQNKNCSGLLVRPMILAHIKQLVNEDKNYDTAIDIYDALIEFWLNREVGRYDVSERDGRKKQIKDLSLDLAQNIYDNRFERKGYYIPSADFYLFLESHGLNNNDIHFRERSLVNRDTYGLIKFSHKSFLEYFIAYRYFNNSNVLNGFNGIDFAKSLYFELCERYFEQNRDKLRGKVYFAEDKHKFRPAISLISKKDDFNITVRAIYLESGSGICLRYLDCYVPEKLFISHGFKTSLLTKECIWLHGIKILSILLDNKFDVNLLRKFPNLEYVFLYGYSGMSLVKLVTSILRYHPNVRIYNNDICISSDLNLINTTETNTECVAYHEALQLVAKFKSSNMRLYGEIVSTRYTARRSSHYAFINQNVNSSQEADIKYIKGKLKS